VKFVFANMALETSVTSAFVVTHKVSIGIMALNPSLTQDIQSVCRFQWSFFT